MLQDCRMSVKLEIDFVGFPSEEGDAVEENADSELDWNLECLEESAIQCKFCYEYFENLKNLREHITEEHCNYECPHCKKRYFKETFLKNHLRHAHLPRMNIKCKLCDKEFSTKYNLQQHLLTHSREPFFKCSFDGCNREFRHISSLKQHEAIHLNRNRKECPICHEYVTKLSSHILSHAEEKPFKCDECEKQFTTPGCLENHKFSSHSNGTFVCEECGASYKNSSSLYKHRRAKHLREVFWCPDPDCRKGFNRKDNLIVHARKFHEIELNRSIIFKRNIERIE